MSTHSAAINKDKAALHLADIDEDTGSVQMNIDFGDKFSEVANKEDEKTVVGLLKAFAALGLSDVKVNEVMASIAEEAPSVAYHQSPAKP